MPNLNNILVAGNGHSFTEIDYRRLPKEYKVMRFNEFYKEDKYYIGKKVDYFVCYSRALEELYYKLRLVNMSDEYEIDMINGFYATVLFEPNKHFPTVKLATKLIQENAAIAEFRCFYEYYYEQYVPTGIQGIALAAVLGFNNIYLAGFDMFLDTAAMHPFDEEKMTQEKFSHIHERHPQNMQTDFLALLQKQFPNTKFLSVSEKSPLSQYIKMAPIIQNEPCYVVEPKDEESRLKTIDVPERIKNKNRDFK
jgi:alpha-2,3 sialyltransferase